MERNECVYVTLQLFNTEQLNNSQDPPSLILTSSAIFPTSRNIYLVLTKSCIILSKDNYASPAANFPFSLGKTSGLQGWTNCPGMLLGKWTISQGPWWKKNSWKRIFFDPYSYANLCLFRTFAWNLLRIPYLVSRTVSSSQLYFLEHL